jgi:site-specific DNA recombinase
MTTTAASAQRPHGYPIAARAALAGAEQHAMKPNGQPERWLIAARLSRVTKSVRLRGDDVINGIHTQDEMCVDWAQAEGHAIVHVSKDRGVSGRVAPWERPELGPWLTEPDKLVQYDGIVASSADRLSRKYFDGGWLREWAERNGKKLYVVKMRLGWPDSGNGLVWAIEFERAQQELEDITERIGRQRQALTAAGKLWGRVPFGYTSEGPKYDRRMVPTEEGRYYVPLIFERLIEGWSQNQIAQWLRDEGVQPESGTWWTRTIGLLIKNPAYMGHRCARDFIPADEEEKIDGKVIRWRYGDTWVTYPRWVYGKTIHRCEPLVDAATWRQANEALSDVRPKRGRYVAANRAMLAGALYCAECEDSPMYRHHSPSPRKGRARVPMFYYRCRNRAQRASCGLMLRMEAVDEAADLIMRRHVRPVTKKQIERGNLAQIEKELEDIRFELRRLGSQELPRAEEQAERERLWAEEDRIKATPIVEDTVVEEETGETWAELWERVPVHERGAWLDRNGFRVTASKARVVEVTKDGFVGKASLAQSNAAGVV